MRELTPEPPTLAKTNIFEISSDKVSPQLINITSGQEVIFKNLSKTPLIVASDPHPSHTNLPSLYLTIFRNKPQSFLFNSPGEFSFHIEANPSLKGKIIVSD